VSRKRKKAKQEADAVEVERGEESKAELVEAVEAAADEEGEAEAGDAESDEGDEGAEPVSPADKKKIEAAKLARLKRIIEALLFAAEKPLTAQRIKQLARERSPSRLKTALEELEAEYQQRGIVLHAVAGGYQFRTHPDCSTWVQDLVAGRPVRLTRAQLETLSIIAYRQPITRPEIDDIRGVDSSGTLHILLERNLIRVLGKKEEPGRPLLYGTTKHFLEFFNLNQLSDLPTLREYHELTEDSMREVERLGMDVEDVLAEPELEAEDGATAPPPQPSPQRGEGVEEPEAEPDSETPTSA
jgi:segregation and condensation protein B